MSAAQGFTFAIPGDLDSPTGGYAYARRVLAEWQKQGVEVDVLGLPDVLASPDDLSAVPGLFNTAPKPFLIDGLAYGVFEESIAKEVGRFGVALVHHPLCDEQGLDEVTRARLEESERVALSFAAGVVAASPATARDLITRFKVPEDRVTIAIPGTDPAAQAPLLGDDLPRIIAVGSVAPRKGYSVLIEALAALRDLPWHCDIHGATDLHDEEVARVAEQIAAVGLQDRIKVLGATSSAALETAYLGSDLFVAPSLHEGYGMAVVEAMAHGLPVVTTTAGALRETAPCAALCEPGSSSSLIEAMRPLINSRAKRVELGATCRAFAQGLPGWDETARIIARAVESIR